MMTGCPVALAPVPAPTTPSIRIRAGVLRTCARGHDPLELRVTAGLERHHLDDDVWSRSNDAAHRVLLGAPPCHEGERRDPDSEWSSPVTRWTRREANFTENLLGKKGTSTASHGVRARGRRDAAPRTPGRAQRTRGSAKVAGRSRGKSTRFLTLTIRRTQRSRLTPGSSPAAGRPRRWDLASRRLRLTSPDPLPPLLYRRPRDMPEKDRRHHGGERRDRRPRSPSAWPRGELRSSSSRAAGRSCAPSPHGVGAAPTSSSAT
mgnify:CR=1 FL=1